VEVVATGTQPPSVISQPGPGEASRRRFGAAPVRVVVSPQLPLWIATTLWFLTALAVLATWCLLYAFVLSSFQEHSAQDALYATLRNELALGVAPTGGTIAPGAPVALLRVPQAGIDDVVVYGTTSGLLEKGPGLKADTPLPGQAGTSIIYGRAALFGGPFRHLNLVRPGDVLEATTGQGTFQYRVLDVRYPRDPQPPALAVGKGRLTLITTNGAGWRSLGAPSGFLYIDASLIGKTVATPAGMPTAIPDSERPMHGDSAALVPLIFWLQALVLAVLAMVWVRSRWGARMTWLVGVPAVLALVWVISETAFQLLPNLI
jgi:sortase A